LDTPSYRDVMKWTK